jgi:HlyD family secretion protein
MRVMRAITQGLTPVILVGLAATVGAYAMRVSAVRKAEAERQLERHSVATTKAAVEDFEVAVQGVGVLEAVESKSVPAQVSGQVVLVVPNGIRVKEGDAIVVLDVPRMERRLRDQEVQYENALTDLETKKRQLATRVERAEISLSQAKADLDRFRVDKEAELTDQEGQRDYDALRLEESNERLERKRRLSEEALLPAREIELGEAAMERDKFNLQRQDKELETAGARKDSELLDKEAAVTRAESELERARSEEQDQIQDAEMRLRIQEQQLDRLRDQLDKAIIRAPADGIVVLSEQREGMSTRPLQPGDQLWEGRPVATIPDLSKMRAVLDVPQGKARLIKRKLPAKITVEALPGTEFEGEVTEVAQTGSEGTFSGTGMPTGERTFRTFVEIEETQGAPLRPGMTANIRIIVETIPDAVTVPLEAVFDRDDRKVVSVKRGDTFEEVEVALGQESLDRVVITKGLKGGELVALRDTAAGGGVASESSEDSPSGLPL